MPEIPINAVQSYDYQTYLTIGDAKGNFNNKVENNQEAKISAKKLCEHEPSEKCQKFLEYLEQSGYAFPELKKRFIKSPKSSPLFPKKEKEIDKNIEKIDEKKIEKLIENLKSENKKIREAAAWSLRKLITPKMSPELKDKIGTTLIEALNDEKVKGARRAIVWALETLAASNLSPELKDKIAGPLSNCLVEKDASIRRAAIFAFEHLTWSKMSLWLESLMILLFTASPPKEKDADVREAVVKILGRLAMSDIIPTNIEADMVEILIETLKDKSSDVRKATVEALGKVAQSNISADQKSKIVASLIKTLKDKGWDVRKTITRALKVSRVEPPYSVLAKENESQGDATAALARIARSNIPQTLKDEIFKSLIQVLKHKNKNVISAATRVFISLGWFDISPSLTTELVNFLIQALEDKNHYLQEAAAWILGSLTDMVWVADPESDGYPPDWNVKVELNISQELKANIIKSLIKTLGDNRAEIRRAAAWALGEFAYSLLPAIPKADMVAPLVETLKDDKDANVREAAVWSLAFLAKSKISVDLKTSMLAPLIRALDDKNKEVMIGAARALRNLAKSNIALNFNPADRIIEEFIIK